MTDAPTHAQTTTPPAGAAGAPSLALSLVRLARPTQWAKGAFVVVGPAYGFAEAIDSGMSPVMLVVRALLAALAFGVASSGCYVLNDLADREADRLHPRKRSRPFAAGHVTPAQGVVFAIALFAVAAAIVVAIPPVPDRPVNTTLLLGLALATYISNVLLYSAFLKHRVIADVMSLSLGFVIRVMAGCAAVGIEPSSWLLNATLFIAMFLAFGKRLGERRTLEADERNLAGHRKVQAKYTDTLLQMAVVVTGVTSLVTYSLYVQQVAPYYTFGFNLMWLTVLPATYALLRAIVLVERGLYDDPTELATHDHPFQFAAAAFAGLTGFLVAWRIWGGQAPFLVPLGGAS